MRCSVNSKPLAVRQMQDQPPLPPFAAIVVAAGKGLRAGQAVPKQFAMWRGKPLVQHSVDLLIAAGANPLVLVIPQSADAEILATIAGAPGLILVEGGDTRQESVRNGLEKLANLNVERVLIHDAARPDVPRSVVVGLLAALDSQQGAIPVLPVVDSLAIDADGLMAGSADRGTLRRVQTPQAFHFDAILAAHRTWIGDPDAGDDAQVLLSAGGKVALVGGDERLKKMTFKEDFMADLPSVRIGSGYDVHRLVYGEDLWLGGVRIDHDKGLSGHSDADVALHAIVDALLGALANGDIGSHFLPSDPRWKGASSDQFLSHAVSLVGEAGYHIGNIDLTIICEAPKIGPHRDAMRARIAELAGVDTGAISVKATTTERLGFAGRGEGIAAQAVVTILRA